jgi:hypothetical protein
MLPRTPGANSLHLNEDDQAVEHALLTQVPFEDESAEMDWEVPPEDCTMNNASSDTHTE